MRELLRSDPRWRAIACCGAGAALAGSWRLIRMVAIAMSRASSPIAAATSNVRGNPAVRP
jgi:hypothetical protein